MKILLVSSSILPQTGGSSVIVENLAKNFSRSEMIVFGSSTFRPNIPNRVKMGPKFKYFFTEMHFLGRGYRYFDWFRKLRLKPLIKAIEETILQENVSHVIGVYPNQFYCLAACRAAKNLNIPFSSYFHNTYVENTAITEPQAALWQAEIFDSSRQIFVMSKGMQAFYENKYQTGKFLPLVHTFNEYPNQDGLTGIPGEKEVYKLVAIGNFNESNLEATRRFLEAIKTNPKYSLSIYTHVPKLLMEKRGLDSSGYKHMGSVAPSEVHSILQKYDVCILTHGFTGGYGEVEYQTIFPTRTIPLLLSGKPILAHSPSGSFLNSFIEDHNFAKLVHEASEEAIINGLDELTSSEHYQQKLVDNAFETAKLFYGPNVASELKHQLNSAQ